MIVFNTLFSGTDFFHLAMSSQIKSRSRINVLGVGIDVLNLELTEKKCFEKVGRSGQQGYVTITGVHGVMESQRDPELLKIHNRSFLSTPDGMPLVWLGRWEGHPAMDRVYGPDLLLQLCRSGLAHGYKHHFFGGAPKVLQPLCRNLEKLFPGIQITGMESPPYRTLTEDELDGFAERLQKEKPHFVWIGLGTPKQEKFMASFLEKYSDLTSKWDHGLLMFGVGAAFDFHSFNVKQAPKWFQKNGLEWFYRLCVDPKRLWRRYSINNSMFLAKIFPAMMGLKEYELKS